VIYLSDSAVSGRGYSFAVVVVKNDKMAGQFAEAAESSRA
jgi:hypothetical protein